MKSVRIITWIGFVLSILAFALIPFSMTAAIVVALLGMIVSSIAMMTSPPSIR